MKSKFTLGFMVGFKNVGKPYPGLQVKIPILEPQKALAAGQEYPIESRPIKNLVFECRKVDDDNAAVFEFMEVQ